MICNRYTIEMYLSKTNIKIGVQYIPFVILK